MAGGCLAAGWSRPTTIHRMENSRKPVCPLFCSISPCSFWVTLQPCSPRYSAVTYGPGKWRQLGCRNRQQEELQNRATSSASNLLAWSLLRLLPQMLKLPLSSPEEPSPFFLASQKERIPHLHHKQLAEVMCRNCFSLVCQLGCGPQVEVPQGLKPRAC